MSNKPKIYATCSAGCLWETIHKDDFEKSAAYILLYHGSGGTVELSAGKDYKFVTVEKADNTPSWSFDAEIEIAYTGNHGANTHSASMAAIADFDKYKNSMKFRYGGIEVDTLSQSGYTTITWYYYIDDVKTSNEVTISGTLTDVSATVRFVSARGTNECLLINEDAQTKATDGTDGKSAFIRYSANADGTDFTVTRSEGQYYVGFATALEAPTNKADYTWVWVGAVNNIAQELGDSEDKALSQKAATEEFDAINEFQNDLSTKLFEILAPAEIKNRSYLTGSGVVSEIADDSYNVYIYDVAERDKIDGVFFSQYQNPFYALYNELGEVIGLSDSLSGEGGYQRKSFTIPKGATKLYVLTYKNATSGKDYQSFNIIRKYTNVVKTCEPMPTNAIPTEFIDVTSLVPSVVYEYSSGNPISLTTHAEQSGQVIPVAEGETYVISGFNNYAWHLYALVFDNATVTPNNYNNEWKWYDNIVVTIPEGAVAMYINSVNSYPTTIKKVTQWKHGNNITGKKLVFDGDSICESRTNVGQQTYNGGAFAKIIANKNFATYDNRAVSGGIITSAVETGISAHSISDNTVNLPTDGDLYCFDGGINDYWNNCTLGDFSPANYSPDYISNLNTSTVCGALEYIFCFCLEHFAGKAICFVITHKISDTFYTPNANGDTWKDYHDKIVGICEKYSIPYYDAFLHSGLNGWNATQSNAYLTAGSNATPTSGDGCHPNEEGYKRYYVGQVTDLFNRILKVE